MPIKMKTSYSVFTALLIGASYTQVVKSSECGRTSNNIFTAISNFIESRNDTARCENLDLDQEIIVFDNKYLSDTESDSTFRSHFTSSFPKIYQSDVENLGSNATIKTSIEPIATEVELETLSGYTTLE